MASSAYPLVLLTGATGYVGGRLLSVLQADGVPLRCLVRRTDALRGRVQRGTEIVLGDVTNPVGLTRALQGVHTAYYLVHSLGVARNFETLERRAAQNFIRAAEDAGVERIIYLGGLGEDSDHLSAHLNSRHEVGRIFGESGISTLEFRAGMIIGSGSLSFELVRALVERLPFMLAPRWVRTPTQPIGIEGVVAYLRQALDKPELKGIVEIGGPDIVSYQDVMLEYARQRGLRRWIIPVPLLTPRLSSLWLGLVTPVYARVGRKLVDSLVHPLVVRNDSGQKEFSVKLRGYREAITRALAKEDQDWAETHWSGAVSSAGQPAAWGGVRFGTRIVDSRAIRVEAPADQVFSVLQRLGGENGWYSAHWLWRLRGHIDLLLGGVGLRRGRRDPVDLAVGEPLDFWRVEAFDPGKRLRLSAEMKVPGRAWLEFEVEREGEGALLKQTALFDPRGLFGLLYWYLLYPLHQYVFSSLLGGIAERSLKPSAER